MAVCNNLRDISNDGLYTGRQLDPETGLQLNRHRFYHQQLGRWASRDPIGYQGSEWNLYEYGKGSPSVNLDPSGERIAKCCLATSVGTTCHFKFVPDQFKGDPCPRFFQEEELTTDESTAILYCLGDRQCQKDLARILTNANKLRDSNYPGGFGPNTCSRWASDFRSHHLDEGPCKKCHVGPEKEFPYNGWWPFFDYHYGVPVCFPSGACIYFDNGWLGEDDHIIFPGDIPPEYR